MKLTKRQVQLTADLKSRLPNSKRLPKVGSIGTILKTESGGAAIRSSDGHVLVKFVGHAWPISLSPGEFEFKS